jgi:hypothetical protein
MKKWEIATIVVFFAVFILLLSSVEQPWQSKTSKVDDMVVIDDFAIWPHLSFVTDRLDIDFMNKNQIIVGSKEYEAGVCWKFVIIDMTITNGANDTQSFSANWIEDENGIRYRGYIIEDTLEGTPHYMFGPYTFFAKLSPGETALISFAYKMPANAVPEKFHYTIYMLNSDTWNGEILLKK